MRGTQRRGLVLAGSVIFLLSNLAVPGAGAQDEGVDEQAEEIIVTARRREETLRDVPFSIDAKTEDRLRELGASTLEDLAHNVAGFTVQNLGPGQSQVAMRGVSAGQVARDLPGVKEQVGVYLDDSVISLSLFTPDLDFFDTNRVEVLRGPQGTLFGSGSLSGTVRFITNQPDLTEFQSITEATGSLMDGAGGGGSLKAAFNIPIVEDKLALRITPYFTKMGGFIDSIRPGGGKITDINDGERWGVRAALRYQPTEALTITPRVIYQEQNIDGFNRQDVFNILANPFTTTRTPVSLGKREQFTQLQESFSDEFLLLDAVIEYDFGSSRLTSVTSYTDRDVLQIRDATQLTASITAQPDILGQPESVFTLDAPLDDATTAQVFTQEVRVASTDDADFQWVFGGFYSTIDRHYGQSLNVAGFEDATGIPTAGIVSGKDILFFSDIPYEFDQFAVFGEGSYAITDELEFTAGLRFFTFEETRVLNFDGIFAAQTIGQKGRTTSDGFTPRFMLAYELNESVNLNAQASKGFRLGGINDPLNEPLCSDEDKATFGGRDSFDDEELWNYEVGAKTRFADGRVGVNVALFWAEIDDLQATLEAGTCSSRIIFNVPSARSRGVEFELTAQPLDGLDFAVAASYTDAELRSTVTSTDLTGATSVVAGIQKGKRLPTTPRFQLSAHATYAAPVTEELTGFVTGSFQHVGSRYTQIGDQGAGFGTVDLTVTPIGAPPVGSTFSFDPKLPSYNIGNLRIGIRSEFWEAAFFVNNLWDENAKLALDRERGGRARVGFLTNTPRTFGITARATF